MLLSTTSAVFTDKEVYEVCVSTKLRRKKTEVEETLHYNSNVLRISITHKKNLLRSEEKRFYHR